MRACQHVSLNQVLLLLKSLSFEIMGASQTTSCPSKVRDSNQIAWNTYSVINVESTHRYRYLHLYIGTRCQKTNCFPPLSYWAVQWSCFARVNALRSFAQEVAASLPGRFLSRRCFTLCITMEVEPRIAKQYICHQIAGERGWRVGKKVSLRRFLAGQKIASSWGIL